MYKCCIFCFPGPGGKTLGIVLGVVLAFALLIIAGLLYRFKCRQMAIRTIRKEYKQMEQISSQFRKTTPFFIDP